MMFTCRLKISKHCERFKTAHSNTDNRHAYYVCRFCRRELPSPSERMHNIFQRLNLRRTGNARATGNG